LGKEIREISSYALEVLMGYDFPGNVRELENIIERGVALETSNIILPENLSLTGSLQSRTNADIGSTAFVAAADEAELYERGLENVITDLEKRLIEHALEQSGNSKTKAAELLGVSFRSLRYKAKKYGL
jgi:two-component system response regulator PilR (NtrC family)